MITVVTAPPFLTVQDLGRTGYRADGIAPSGAMDLAACRAANAAAGNTPEAAVLEWAVAGGVLRFDVATTIALAGATVTATIDDVPVDLGVPVAVPSGAELHVTRFLHGRFLYVGVAGGVDVPVVLGSRSTNIVAGFGGFDGRCLRRGDILPVGRANTKETVLSPAARIELRRGQTAGDHTVRVVRGPQAGLLDEKSWSAFLGSAFTISHASDRMGYRLHGPALHHHGSATLPSEPSCVGAVQAPDGGTPIVLMNDGPTIGGYPKVAVITAADLDGFAQCVPGDVVRFVLVEI